MGVKKINGDLNVTGTISQNGTVISYPNISSVYNIGTLIYDYDGQAAIFQSSISNYHAPSSGLCILMFNTTCIIFPYSISQNQNRFACSTVYDTYGNTRVTRGYLHLSNSGSANSSHCSIFIKFDNTFSECVLNNDIHPYGIIRFIGL